jgi:hypothetical protein
MGTSQIIMVIFMGINLLLGAYLHGKPKTGDYNFWITAISAGLYFLILTTGGFFK